MSFTKLAIFAVAISVQTSDPVELPSIERAPVQESGVATWYGEGSWHGSVTANGETFRPWSETTCAHRTLPFGTIVTVVRTDTGDTTRCRINDRGPYMTRTDGGPREFNPPGEPLSPSEHWHGILDMSAATARRLDAIGEGVVPVRLRYNLPDSRTDFHVAEW